jgi:hypothetical protein
MNTKPLTEEHMWDIIDGVATPEIIIQHKALLQHDIEYKNTFDTIVQLQNQLLQLDLEQPSMRFTQNVIEKVAAPTKATVKPDKAFPLLIMLLFGLCIVTIISVLIFNGNASAQPISFLPKLSLGEKLTTILSNPLVMPIFIVINAGLALMAVDKWILKNYFQK